MISPEKIVTYCYKYILYMYIFICTYIDVVCLILDTEEIFTRKPDSLFFVFPHKLPCWILCVCSFNFYTEIVFECYKSAGTQDGDKIV